MKKIVLSAALLLASAAMVSAQVTWGVKAGYSNSNYNIGVKGLTIDASLGAKSGFYVGGLGNLAFSDNFGLQFELLYSMDGTRIGLTEDFLKDRQEANAAYAKNSAAALTFHHINLPIMAKFQPVGGLSVMFGPYFSYSVANSVRLNSNLKDFAKPALESNQSLPLKYDDVIDYAKDLVKDNTQQFNVGLAFGVEYQFCDNMFIDFRYNLGLLNMIKEDYQINRPAFIDGLDDTTWDGLLQGLASIKAKGNWKDVTGYEPKAKYHSFQIGLGYRF